MNDLVSVLMCVYDTPVEYLSEAIDSILGQNYSPIEFIIIDDNSDNEDVKECLARYESSNSSIHLFRNCVNLGLTKSLNIGLTHCQGNYIARMDSDDVAVKERISFQVDYLKNNPEVALVGSDILLLHNNKELEQDYSTVGDIFDYPELYNIKSLLQHSGPPHPTFMFNAKFIRNNNIRYREEIRKAQDYGIMVDILKNNGVIRKIKKPLLKYRIHEGQISAKSEIQQKLFQHKVSHDYLRYSFHSLSNTQCTALAFLGEYNWYNQIIEALGTDSSLDEDFRYILNDLDEFKDPRIFQDAIKTVIDCNRKCNQFNQEILVEVLNHLWWKLALQRGKGHSGIRNFNFETILSYRYVLFGKYRNYI